MFAIIKAESRNLESSSSSWSCSSFDSLGFLEKSPILVQQSCPAGLNGEMSGIARTRTTASTRTSFSTSEFKLKLSQFLDQDVGKPTFHPIG